MNLLVKLIPNKICIGCACHGYVEEKTCLCCACFGIKIAVEERKRKLSSTMRQRYAGMGMSPKMKERMERVRRQLEGFRTKSASA